MTDVLQLAGLSRRYGQHVALDALDLTVAAGQLVALIGPNGAGKSTTMRIVAGLQLQDEGRIVIAGADVTDDPGARKARVGLTPQDVALFEHLSAAETLRLVCAVRGVPEGEIEERVGRWLDIARLADRRGRMVAEFSGGMKRKLAVAAALVADPPLAILDESFTGLDAESTRALVDALRGYVDEGGAVLLSSHRLELVERIADRVVMLVDGRLRADWSRAELDALIPSQVPSLVDLYLAQSGSA